MEAATDEDLSDSIAASATPTAAAIFSKDLAGALVGTIVSTTQIMPALADAITVDGAFDAEALANLIEHLAASGAASASMTLQGTASARLSMTDRVLTAWAMLVESGVAASDEAAGTVHKLAAIVDALAATGQANGRLDAFSACVSAIAMEDLIARGFSPEAVDGVTLADVTAGTARMLAPLLDALAVTATGVPALHLSVVSADSLAVDADIAAQLSANADLADGLLLYVTLRLGDADYAGWVLNTDSKAASEYRNFPFDSFATFRGQHYAAGPNGIARLTGSTDDGENIDAWLRTTLTHYGTEKLKRTPDCYLGITTAGDMVLKVVAFDPYTGTKSEDWYAVRKRQAAGPGVATVEIGRGLKSTFFQYELHNVDGADFALDSLRLRPVVLDRR
jgi:hypothetical protein